MMRMRMKRLMRKIYFFDVQGYFFDGPDTRNGIRAKKAEK